MARALSRTLNHISASQLPNPTILHGNSASPPSSSSPLGLSLRLLTHRSRSNKSGKAQLVEVDLESESGSEVEVMSVRKLEDVIHSIVVQRSAPDWLPFIPGSSYWVPPRRGASGVVEVVRKFTKPLGLEESLSCSTVRGWPSSDYFFEGSAPVHPLPLELQVEVEVKIQDNSIDASRVEDEEG